MMGDNSNSNSDSCYTLKYRVEFPRYCLSLTQTFAHRLVLCAFPYEQTTNVHSNG